MLTNDLNLPQPFVDAATSDHKYKHHRYSVTEVLGGTCEAILKRRHHGEGDSDVADYVWAIFGSAVHKILEQAKETDSQLKENWLSVKVGVEDYEMSGIFDLYDDETGTVTDYKTSSIWKVKFGDYSDWRTQTLLYCWMLRKTGFAAHRGEIVALLKDHNKRDAKYKASEGYPQHPVFKIGWDFSEDDFTEIEMKVLYWFNTVAEQEQIEDELLEPCTPAQRWSKSDKWAVKKKNVKRALRVYDSEAEAVSRMEEENAKAGKPVFAVEYRKGEDTKCEGYCSMADFCPYAMSLRSE